MNHPTLPWALVVVLACAAVCPGAEPGGAESIFAKDNLVAWCLVPFDASGRNPEQRAAMLADLGLRRFAYDWRAQHVPTFEDEIVALKRHDVEFTAYWCSGGLSDTNRKMFALFEKHGIRPQLWVTPGGPSGETQEQRVANVARGLLPLVEEADRLGCRLALYNHGGWQGEPENLVALTHWLRDETGKDHVGIVYNLHHGHEHLERFPAAFKAMVPYLFCVNLNGMTVGGQKILPLGSGEEDLSVLKMIRDSGYRGLIGILDHRPEMDAKESLQRNLDGLKTLREKLGDSAQAAKPAKNVLIVVGPSSHPPGTHEVAAGGRVMEHCLKQVEGVEVDLVEGWPENKRLVTDAATIVFIGDIFPPVMLPEPEKVMADVSTAMDRGCGIVCVHYATGLRKQHVAEDGSHPLLGWLGGYFATGGCPHHKSVARIVPATLTPEPIEHPVLRGWKEFHFDDEPYWNNYFGKDGPADNVTPLVSTMLPPDAPKKETVVWAVERPDGGRGVGLVIPHYFRNWQIDDLRMLVLNSICWTAQCEIPADGIQTSLTDLVQFAPASVEPKPRTK